MNILLLAPQPFFQHRGTPIAVRLLAEELGAMGHRIDLLVLHEGEDITIPGVRLHRIPRLRGLAGIGPGLSAKKIACDVLLLGKAVHLLRSNRYQLIHAVEEAAFIARILGWLFRIPFVYDMDSSMSQQIIDKFPGLQPIRPMMEWFEYGMMRSSAGIIAVCRSLEEQARRVAPGVTVLRLEDVSLLEEEAPPVEDIRQATGFDGKLLLYVGNLERYQGMDLLLAAFALLPEQERDAAGLVIIGGTEADIAHYRSVAEEGKIGHRVCFLGPRPVEHLGGYLRQADILVSPRMQGNNTPMKIYSYLDSGRPVLATDLPTHTQVLDKDIALLAKPDAGEFMQAMVVLLADEKLRKELAVAAQAKVQAEFSRQAFRRKLASFYGELAAQLPPAR